MLKEAFDELLHTTLNAIQRCHRDRLLTTDGDRAALLTRFSRALIRIRFNDEHRWGVRLYATIVPARTAVVHRVERDLAALISLCSNRNPARAVLHTSKEMAMRLSETYGLKVLVGCTAQDNGQANAIIKPGVSCDMKAGIG